METGARVGGELAGGARRGAGGELYAEQHATATGTRKRAQSSTGPMPTTRGARPRARGRVAWTSIQTQKNFHWREADEEEIPPEQNSSCCILPHGGRQLSSI